MSSPYPYAGSGTPLPEHRPPWGPRLVVIGMSLALFVGACCAPALLIGGSEQPMPGGGLLFIGWMGIVAGQFAWFANPIYALALLLIAFRKWVPATLTAAIALLVALDTLMMFVQEVPTDEAGVNSGRMSSLQIGFFLWIASIAAVVLGATWLAFRDRRT